MDKIIVIGGGAAGLMAAFFAASRNKEVLILEKNEKIGKKLYITGKGRCNLTNDSCAEDFLNNVVTNPKFIYGAVNSFLPEDTIAFFEKFGLTLKTERGNRVFPASDKSSDVIKTFQKACDSVGVKILLNHEVSSLIVEDGAVKGVKTSHGNFDCDAVIVCTGGVSYPLTGSTGDGYRFAEQCGHTIISPKPALCGINLKGDFYKELQGLSLKNVKLSALYRDKVIYSEMGEMLFTHFGVSGPIVLSCSSVINKYYPDEITLSLDLKPALNDDTLDKRILREFDSFGSKSLSNALMTLVPKSLIGVISAKSGLDADKKCCLVSAKERAALLSSLKNFTMKVKSLCPIEEAIVTSGGVNVKEINPKTMESKLVKNLYFAGEVIDVDSFTGGFNIQTAFSTGCAAGKNV